MEGIYSFKVGGEGKKKEWHPTRTKKKERKCQSKGNVPPLSGRVGNTRWIFLKIKIYSDEEADEAKVDEHRTKGERWRKANEWLSLKNDTTQFGEVLLQTLEFTKWSRGRILISSVSWIAFCCFHWPAAGSDRSGSQKLEKKVNTADCYLMINGPRKCEPTVRTKILRAVSWRLATSVLTSYSCQPPPPPLKVKGRPPTR